MYASQDRNLESAILPHLQQPALNRSLSNSSKRTEPARDAVLRKKVWERIKEVVI